MGLALDLFGFRALWSPYYFLVMVFLAGGYFLITGPWRHKFEGAEPVPVKKKIYFLSGILLLYIVKGSPMDLLGHLMFSMHMTQMALLYLAVPPLLLLGTPAWLIRSVFTFKPLKKIAWFMTNPLLAILLFNGFFSLYHLPQVFDRVKTDMWIHGIYTTVLFIFALAMWWLIVDPLPEWSRLSELKKIAYMFANGVLITPACALLIFADSPLFATYTDPALFTESLKLCVPLGTLSGLTLSGPELFSIFPIMEDQQLGGIVMKFMQEIIYGIAIGYTFFAWARRERKEEQEEISNMKPVL